MRSPNITTSIYANTLENRIQRIIDNSSIRNKARAIKNLIFAEIQNSIMDHTYNTISVNSKKITICNRGHKMDET